MSYRKFPPDIDWVVIVAIIVILAVIAVLRIV